MCIDYRNELDKAKAEARLAEKRANRAKQKAKKWKRQARQENKENETAAAEIKRLRAENVTLNHQIDLLREGFMILRRKEK